MTSRKDVLEALKVLGPPAPSDIKAHDRDSVEVRVPKRLCFTVVVLGASGDLAKKKTFPALFLLFSRGYVQVSLACSIGQNTVNEARATILASIRLKHSRCKSQISTRQPQYHRLCKKQAQQA